MASKKNIQRMKWLILSLAILFYFYEYFLRFFPSIIVSELITSFHVTASTIGMISAFYFYAYAPMQLPVGFLYDRFGAKKPLIFASLMCGVGGLLFGYAHTVWHMEIGRMFMGAGSAFAFIGTIYIISHWFDRKRQAFLIAISNSIGMLGAAVGQGPLNVVVDIVGWREASIYGFGIIGIFLSIVFFIFVKNEPKEIGKNSEKKSFSKVWRNFFSICLSRQTWLISIVGMTFYATIAAFAGMWGVPFLQAVYPYKKTLATFAPSMIFIGCIIGGPVFGLLSDMIKNRKKIITFGSFFSFLCLLPVIYLEIPLHIVFSLLFLVGIFISTQLLCYVLAIEHNSPHVKGTAAAFVNFLVYIIGAFLQWLVGWLLDFWWQEETNYLSGPIYSIYEYRKALSCFPITLLIAFVLSFFIRDKKYTKQTQ